MSQAIASQAIKSQAIAGQIIISWAIGDEEVRFFWKKKNNKLIDEKPHHSMEIEEIIQYWKPQVHLGFLFLVINQSLLRPVVHRITPFAIHYCG